MTALFNTGKFRLHSGGTSSFKIDCDALTDTDLETLATLVAEQLCWRVALGIGRGGSRFAEKLARYNTPSTEWPRLIVDDVWTTGGSMRDERARHPDPESSLGVVIFARTEPDEWVHAIFKMWDRGI